MIAFIVAALQMTVDPCVGLPQGHVAAVEARATHDVAAAITDARAIRDRLPACADAHLGYAIALNHRLQASSGLKALTRSREYRAALDRVIALAPNSVRARADRAEFFMYAPSIAGGNAQKARAEVEALSTLAPVEAARLSVELESRADDTVASLAALERFADLAPGNATVPRLAQRLILLGRHRDAERRLLAVLEANEGADARALAAVPFLRGRLRVLGGFELPEAVAHLESYLAAGGPREFRGLPSRAVVLYRIGEALEKRGACPEAAARFEEAARLDAAVDGLRAAQDRVRACERTATAVRPLAARYAGPHRPPLSSADALAASATSTMKLPTNP